MALLEQRILIFDFKDVESDIKAEYDALVRHMEHEGLKSDYGLEIIRADEFWGVPLRHKLKNPSQIELHYVIRGREILEGIGLTSLCDGAGTYWDRGPVQNVFSEKARKVIAVYNLSDLKGMDEPGQYKFLHRTEDAIPLAIISIVSTGRRAALRQRR